MTKRTRVAKFTGSLLLAGVVWMVTSQARVSAQSQPTNETHHAPENISGTMKDNETDLLSSWRFLSGLAVRLLSGNEAELLSGNAPELLSGNEPELLSGNKTSLLSGNEPNLLSGNTLFSNNTIEIHIIESGNAPTLGSLAKSLTSGPSQRIQAEQAKRQDALQAKLRATEAKAKAMAEKEKAEAKAMYAELAKMRSRLAVMSDQNAELRQTIKEMKASQDNAAAAAEK